MILAALDLAFLCQALLQGHRAHADKLNSISAVKAKAHQARVLLQSQY